MSSHACTFPCSAISSLKKGIVPDFLKNEPFIVIRKALHVPFVSQVQWEWEVSFSPMEEDSLDIPRKTALLLIEENNMELAYSALYGQIYELPGCPFREIFGRGANYGQAV